LPEWQYLREVLRGLAEHKDSRILEGHLMPDPIHMFVGPHFGARGLFVSTAGSDEEVVRQYIRVLL